jgi:hypothetical protein
MALMKYLRSGDTEQKIKTLKSILENSSFNPVFGVLIFYVDFLFSMK